MKSSCPKRFVITSTEPNSSTPQFIIKIPNSMTPLNQYKKSLLIDTSIQYKNSQLIDAPESI